MRQRNLEFIILLGELACFYLALAITLSFRYGLSAFSTEWAIHVLPFSIIFVVWLVISYTSDLCKLDVFTIYPRRYIVVLFVYFIISVVFFYIFPSFDITPKTNAFFPVVLTGILSYAWRELLKRILIKLSMLRPLVVAAGQNISFDLIKEIHANAHSGFRVLAVFCDPRNVPVWLAESDIKLIHSSKELIDYCRNNTVYAITIEDNYKEPWLFRLLRMHVRVFHVTTLWEEILEYIPVHGMREYLAVHHLSRNVYSSVYLVVKRVFDCLFVLLLLPIILIPVACIALTIRLTSRGAVLYSQIRVGRYGQLFYIYKFRSMTDTAEKDGVQWAKENDSRITPFGAFLRRSHLDELPQLINVLLGDMSLIGPRPERPEFTDILVKEIPYYTLRYILRPGVSGWTQVQTPYGSSVTEIMKRTAYDFYYIKNFSLILDIRIFFKTILQVLSRRGR